MDDYVKKYLQQWELEELIPKFADEEVNKKAFKCLSDDIIKELIPKLGKRAIFNSAYKQYREALLKNPPGLIKLHPTILSEEVQLNPDSSVHETKNVPADELSDPSEHLESNLIQKDEISQNESPSEPDFIAHNQQILLVPQASPFPHNSNPITTNKPDLTEQIPVHRTFSISHLANPSEEDHQTAESLRLLLKQSSDSSLANKSFLTRTSRELLSDEIVRHLCDQHGGTLNVPLLSSWARAIELVFETEVAELYFRQSDDGRFYAGKLYKSYQQLREREGRCFDYNLCSLVWPPVLGPG